MALITGALFNSMSVFGATAGTYKISGYVEPDFHFTNSMTKADFKVEIVGTSYSDVTDSMGYFEIPNIPIAASINVKVRFSKAGYLRKEIGNLTIGSEVLIGSKEDPVKMWPGDVLQDDAINFVDVLLMAKSYNAIKNEVLYSKICDFNLDSSVNVADVIIMSRHFNAVPNEYATEKVSYVAPDKPGAPQNLKALWYTGSTISLSWEAPSIKTSISGYEIYLNDKVAATSKTTNITCSGLNPNKENTIYIKSINSSNVKSDASNILRITTPIDDHGNTIDRATPIECEKEVVASMESNDTADYFKFKPQVSGTYVFKMYVGSKLYGYLYNEFGEKMGVFNTDQFNLIAGKEYTLGIKNVSTYGEYRFYVRQKTIKPDIVVDKILVDNACIKEPSSIKIRIVNIGDAPNTSSFRVALDIDGQNNLLWADCDTIIPAGNIATLSINGGFNGLTTWTPMEVGIHSITANADILNRVTEVFEDNNTFSCSVFFDDYSDSLDYARAIQLGKEVTGIITSPQDKDFFTFIPSSNGNYKFELPGSHYTNVYVYDKDLNQVAETTIATRGGARNSCYVKAPLEANQKYYILVRTADSNDFINETYKLVTSIY